VRFNEREWVDPLPLENTNISRKAARMKDKVKEIALNEGACKVGIAYGVTLRDVIGERHSKGGF
jgi:hypothetical protein